MNLEIAKRLYEYRKTNNLSQEELAEKVGVSRQAVSKWERGEASPDTDNLIMLADIYGITLDELVKGKAEKNNSADSQKETQPKDDKSPTKDEVHISFKNGIHVNDKKSGESVHVDWSGVHVDSNDSHVHIDKNGVFVEENGHIYCDNSKPKFRHINLFYAFPYPIVTAIAYLIFGFFGICGGWGLGWLIFLTIPLYYSLVSAVSNRNAAHFAYPILAVLIFLWSGFELCLWHPMWIIFLTIPIYYFLCRLFKKQ